MAGALSVDIWFKIMETHSVSTDRSTWYPPQACKFLKQQHHFAFLFREKHHHQKNDAIYKG